MKLPTLLITLASTALASCASHPVKMSHLDYPEVVLAEHSSAYSTDKIGPDTMRVLDALGLSNLSEDASGLEAAADKLGIAQPGAKDADRLFARAEILYWLADRSPFPAQLWLDSAIAAHEGLQTLTGNGFDPVWSRGLASYDHALARYLSHRLSTMRDDPAARLGEGETSVEVIWELTGWESDAFDEWHVAAEFLFEGIRNRHRRMGVGVPLILKRRPEQGIPAYLTPEAVVRGATAVLEPGTQRPILRILDPTRRDKTSFTDVEVPIAADFTAPYGYLLAKANLHELEDTSFFEADAQGHEGLFLLEDYDPDRSPLIMVHGLWSSPFTWREITNEVFGDPLLRQHYQVWHYMYPTGAPLLENARNLRKTLRRARLDLDPELDDFASQNVTLIGHSMGGLLSRIVMQSSGDRIWNTLFSLLPEELELDSEQRELANELYFFEPLEFVDRVIFIATPHRGSELSDSFIGRLGSALMSIPPHLIDLVQSIREQGDDVVRVDVPTIVDELSGSHEVMITLSELPIREGLIYHSIMGDVSGDPENPSDSVVTFASSTLSGAKSELIVPGADHGVHLDARAAAEVRRILGEAVESRK